MLRISWTENLTNKVVLVRANEARSMLKTIWCRNHRCLGHVLRHDNLLHSTLLKGKRWQYYLG